MNINQYYQILIVKLNDDINEWNITYIKYKLKLIIIILY